VFQINDTAMWVLRTVPSIFLGATLVVSGDGRYYSEQAIQVLLTYIPFLPFDVDFFVFKESDLSIMLFRAVELNHNYAKLHICIALMPW
jgi:hypothetical protein